MSWVCLQFVIVVLPFSLTVFNCWNLHLYFKSMQMNIESLGEYRYSARGSDKERENVNYLYMYHKYIMAKRANLISNLSNLRRE